MRHRQAIAILALAGFFVALYLYLYKIGVLGELKCGTGGCEVVQASQYAVLFGRPVAWYGVVGYAVLVAVAIAGLQPALAARRWPTQLLAVLATGGFLFTLYLTYLELFVIHAICRWCVGSAVIITATWLVAVHGVRRGRMAASATS